MNNNYATTQNPMSFQTPTNQYESYFNQQLMSNIIRVVSLEDAVMRTPNRPCDMVYFNQDKDEFYRVSVDMYGKKTWYAFPFTSPNQQDIGPVTRAEYNELVAKVNTLMSGGRTNGELDGQNVQQ